jgi:hypothetical protein
MASQALRKGGGSRSDLLAPVNPGNAKLANLSERFDRFAVFAKGSRQADPFDARPFDARPGMPH